MDDEENLETTEEVENTDTTEETTEYETYLEFKNKASGGTPLNADNLNYVQDAIKKDVTNLENDIATINENIDENMKTIDNAKLPLAGGTMTGLILSEYGDCAMWHTHPTTLRGLKFGVGASGANRGIYDTTDDSDNWMVYRDSSNNLILQATEGNVYIRPNASTTGQAYIDTDGMLHLNNSIVCTTTGTYSCGTSNYRWKNVYSNNYYNSLGRVQETQTGKVSITPSAANTSTGVAVTFSNTFSGTPAVFTQANTGVPGTSVLGTGFTGASSTGVTIYLTRANTIKTNVWWLGVY